MLRSIGNRIDLKGLIELHPENERSGGPLAKQRVIVIPPIMRDDCPGMEPKLRNHFDIGHFPLGDQGKRGKVFVMIQI